MASNSSGAQDAAQQADRSYPDLMMQYLTSLGVKSETTRSIKDQLDQIHTQTQAEQRKQEQDLAMKKNAAIIANAAIGSAKSSGSAAAKANAERATREYQSAKEDMDVKKFAVKQGMDAAGGSRLGNDSVMVWGILEGQPQKIHSGYDSLMEYVESSWELYKAEFEAVTFPVFVHCYLILVTTGHTDEARIFMESFHGIHEARYRQEVTELKMVTTQDHIASSDYAQRVLKYKFRVRMSLAGSKMLNAFLVNSSLLAIMHILNTRIMFLIRDGAPAPSLQVVHCGPNDTFASSLRGTVGVTASAADAHRKAASIPDTTNPGSMSNSTTTITVADSSEEMKSLQWAAGPNMEVALLKQSEKDAVAYGLHYPLPVQPKGSSTATSPPPSQQPSSQSSSSPTTAMMSSSAAATASANAASGSPEASSVPGGGGVGGSSTAGSAASALVTNGGVAQGTAAAGSGGSQGEGGSGGGGGGAVGATIGGPPMNIPTGSAATAERRQRESRLERAKEAAEATAKAFGGLQQKQVHLPRKRPPLPDATAQWDHLRLSLRPLDSRLLKDALATPEGGTAPFVANPLSPHVVMMTFFNAMDTLCCLQPTRDGMQVAAGFSDRMVRAWRTAPNAPYPRAADEAEPAVPHSSWNSETGGVANEKKVAWGKETAGGWAGEIRTASGSGGSAPAENGKSAGSGSSASGGGGAAVAASWGGVFVGDQNSGNDRGGNSGGAGGAGAAGEKLSGDDAGREKSGSAGATGERGSQQPVRFVGHCKPVYGVAWSPDGRFLLSSGGDGAVRLWDLARDKGGANAAGYVRYDGHRGPVWAVAFDPVGYYFATGAADRTACLWSTDCAQPLRIFAGHLKGVLCVAFHPNGNYVLTGSMDKTARVWDIQTGECVRLLAGHAGSITCIAVSPSGRHIAGGCNDGFIRLWDIATGHTLAVLRGHTADVDSVDFSVEGSALVSGGKDNAVMVWDVTKACSGRGPGSNDRNTRDIGSSTASPAAAEGGDSNANSKGKAAGMKRKARLWSSTEDDSSHGPVHTFRTRNTRVHSVLFTKRNLIIAAGVCHGK